ncbi:hypothetical protein Tco_0170444 [Tanacetum coccineum]
MTIFLKILRRARDAYHNLQDDDIMKNIFNSGRNKNMVRMRIPTWMITEEMKLMKHSKMYAEVFGLDVPPVVTTSDEQNSPISLQESDEFNQEDSAEFDGNTQFVPCDSLNHEEIESSTTNLEPSNVQNFYQVQPSTHI